MCSHNGALASNHWRNASTYFKIYRVGQKVNFSTNYHTVCASEACFVRSECDMQYHTGYIYYYYY